MLLNALSEAAKSDPASLDDVTSVSIAREIDSVVERLATELPLPQLSLPFLFSADLGPDDLAVLSDAVTVGIEALPVPAVAPAGAG